MAHCDVVRAATIRDEAQRTSASSGRSSSRTRRDTTCCSPCSTRAASTRWPAGSGSSTTTARSWDSRCSRRRGGTSGSARHVRRRDPRARRGDPRTDPGCGRRSRTARRSSRGTSPNGTVCRSRRSRPSASTSSSISQPVATARGALRLAGAADRPMLVEWASSSPTETGHRARDGAEDSIDLGIAARAVSGCGTTAGPVSMAGASNAGRRGGPRAARVHAARAPRRRLRDRVRRAPEPNAHRPRAALRPLHAT